MTVFIEEKLTQDEGISGSIFIQLLHCRKVIGQDKIPDHVFENSFMIAINLKTKFIALLTCDLFNLTGVQNNKSTLKRSKKFPHFVYLKFKS